MREAAAFLTSSWAKVIFASVRPEMWGELLVFGMKTCINFFKTDNTGLCICNISLMCQTTHSTHVRFKKFLSQVKFRRTENLAY